METEDLIDCICGRLIPHAVVVVEISGIHYRIHKATDHGDRIVLELGDEVPVQPESDPNE